MPAVPSTIVPSPNPALAGYSVSTNYVWDMGVAGFPTGGPIGTPASVVQMYAPICYKKVDWSIRTATDKPIAPSPNTGQANEILCGKQIGGALPVDANDGSGRQWTFGGTYWYLLLVPPSDVDRIPLGLYPYSELPTSQSLPYPTCLEPADFSAAILASQPVTSRFAAYPFPLASGLGQG